MFDLTGKVALVTGSSQGLGAAIARCLAEAGADVAVNYTSERSLEKAETVADLVEIENSIADTQYLIDSYTASLKNYDSLVDESTVNVTLSEVTPREAAPEKGFFEKAWLGLEDSLSDGWRFLQEAGLFLIAALPYLAIVAAVYFIVRAIVRSRRARKER